MNKNKLLGGALFFFSLAVATQLYLQFIVNEECLTDVDSHPLNTNYITFNVVDEGEAGLIPLKVFSNSECTFFEFDPSDGEVTIFEVESEGAMMELKPVKVEEPYVAVRTLFAESHFLLKSKSGNTLVKENKGGGL